MLEIIYMALCGKKLKQYFRTTLGYIPDNWKDYSGMSILQIEEAMKFQSKIVDDLIYPPVVLGNCTAATPCVEVPFGIYPYEVSKQEGNNPMYNTKATSALSSLTINAPEACSDEMTQRDYLLSELKQMAYRSWDEGHKLTKLRKQFNLDAPMYPATSQGIIDAFKNGKVVIDQAKVDRQTAFFAASGNKQDDLWEEDIRSKYFGITFTDLPVADAAGYKAAHAAYEAEQKLTERTIHIASPADGLKALLAFEAWMPTPATTTVQ